MFSHQTGPYDTKTREQVEGVWRDKVATVEPHYLTEQGAFSDGLLNRLTSWAESTGQDSPKKVRLIVLTAILYRHMQVLTFWYNV